MVTASELVGTPALQLVEVFQLPPLAPIQESAVSGGAAFRFAASIALAVDAGFWLSSACCESLCSILRLRRSQSAKVEKNSNKAEAAIHKVIWREDDGRIGRSRTEDLYQANSSRTMISAGSSYRARSVHRSLWRVLTKF